MKRRETPFIVPVFIPQQGCPHQCVFCNQKAITGHSAKWPCLKQLKVEAEKYLSYNDFRKPSIMAFYGGNFLGLSREKIERLLILAQDFVDKGKIQGIRFSTRPDTVSEKRLKILDNFAITEIELGVQSMDDRVLDFCQRGHGADHTKKAIKRLKDHGYKTGLQLMIGLPGQDEKSVYDTAKQVAALLPDFVRIYPTIVFNQSLLADWYRTGKYQPLSLKEAVYQTKNIYLFFRQRSIPVIRMGLQSSPELADKNIALAGPYHPAFGHLVISAIFFDMMYAFLLKKTPGIRQVQIAGNPRCISQVRGIRNENIRKLKNHFDLDEIKVLCDPALSPDGLFIDHQWVDLLCSTTTGVMNV